MWSPDQNKIIYIGINVTMAMDGNVISNNVISLYIYSNGQLLKRQDRQTNNVISLYIYYNGQLLKRQDRQSEWFCHLF